MLPLSEYDVCYFEKTGGYNYMGRVANDKNGVPCRRWTAGSVTNSYVVSIVELFKVYTVVEILVILLIGILRSRIVTIRQTQTILLNLF